MTGTIVGISGSWGSGIASLTLRDSETGENTILHADNGPLMRALDSAFPGFITENHTVDPSVIEGVEIEYEVDDMMPNMLAGFNVL